MVHEIATALLPVFFVLALGYGAGIRKFIDSRNASTLNQLVMVFAIPAPLFVSISSKQRSAIASHGTYIVVIVIAMLPVYVVILWLPLSSAVVGNRGAIAVTIGIAIGSMTISPLTLALPEGARVGSGRTRLHALPLRLRTGQAGTPATATSCTGRPGEDATQPPADATTSDVTGQDKKYNRLLGRETTHALRITSP